MTLTIADRVFEIEFVDIQINTQPFARTLYCGFPRNSITADELVTFVQENYKNEFYINDTRYTGFSRVNVQERVTMYGSEVTIHFMEPMTTEDEE